MKVLTVFADPNPKSFCHVILKQLPKDFRTRVTLEPIMNFLGRYQIKRKNQGKLGYN